MSLLDEQNLRQICLTDTSLMREDERKFNVLVHALMHIMIISCILWGFFFNKHNDKACLFINMCMLIYWRKKIGIILQVRYDKIV